MVVALQEHNRAESSQDDDRRRRVGKDEAPVDEQILFLLYHRALLQKYPLVDLGTFCQFKGITLGH